MEKRNEILELSFEFALEIIDYLKLLVNYWNQELQLVQISGKLKTYIVGKTLQLNALLLCGKPTKQSIGYYSAKKAIRTQIHRN